MSKPLQQALESLNKQFVIFCTEVEQNVHLAVQAFLKTEQQNVKQVQDKDIQINKMEIAIEEECLRIIAMYQPLATDLRVIIGILKMTNDLERIGDLAVNIVNKVTLFSDQETSLSKQGTSFFLPEMKEKFRCLYAKKHRPSQRSL